MIDSNIRNHLSLIDTYDLQRNIDAFRRLPLRKMSREELSKHINDALSIDTQNGQQAILTISIGTYPVGTRFYRVRSLDTNDTIIPLRGMRTEADAWEPPAEHARKSRLNREGEPLLYTSPMSPFVAVEETKIDENTNFALIVYVAKEEIKVATIGDTPDVPSLTKDEKLKIKMLNDFLHHEFTRDVGEGTEFLYDISEVIAKDYYDGPPQFQDAWCYPSVAARPAFNVCFRPQIAREKLALLGVQIATYQRLGDSMTFHVKCVASGFDADGTFLYHAIGSDNRPIAF